MPITRSVAALAAALLFVLASDPVLAARSRGYRAPPPRRAPTPARSVPKPAPKLSPKPAPSPKQVSPKAAPQKAGAGAGTAGKTAAGSEKPPASGKPAAKAGEGASKASPGVGAKSAQDGLKLNKSLASQAQMKEAGTVIAGGPGKPPFRDADRVARTHGGQPQDWVKKSSSSYKDKDGSTQETHWVENTKTGARVEYKTILNGKK